MIGHVEPIARRDSRGLFYLIEPFGESIKVFHADGRFAQLIGRKGGGPGEYDGIVALTIDRGDTLHVFDATLRRYTALAPNYKFIRSSVLPIAPTMRSLHTGRYLVINATVRTPDAIGLPVHVIAPDGRLLSSTGSVDGIYRPDIPDLDKRSIGAIADHGVWAAHRIQYNIDRIDLASGKIVQTLLYRPRWFTRISLPRQSALAFPRTMIVDVRPDRDGRLWILSAAADQAWESAIGPSSHGVGHFEVLDEHRYRDSVIDVFDPVMGKLVASLRTDRFFHQFVSDSLLASVDRSGDGVSRLAIWSAKIRNP